jgi:hypothetical protein
MSPKLVKVYLPESVHRWIKSLANWHEQEIGPYVADLVRTHMPKEVKFSERGPTKKKSSDAESPE